MLTDAQYRKVLEAGGVRSDRIANLDGERLDWVGNIVSIYRRPDQAPVAAEIERFRKFR
jgi:hypothetical protein